MNANSSIEVAAKHDNIILESSAIRHPSVLQEAVDTLGADKVVYGSDMPPANPHVELKKIEILELTDDQRERILHRNAAEILDIWEAA